MKTKEQKSFVWITRMYWLLLVYIVALVVWWFISLQMQNKQMSLLLINELDPTETQYQSKLAKIIDGRNRKTTQFITEGATFIILSMLGALFVYRATLRQLRLSQQQQNFMMAITHELKTPIAVAKLNLETIQRRKLDESQQNKLIFNTLQEANRLNDLCNNILLASQFDAGAYQVNKTEVDLSKVVVNSVAQYKERFANRCIVADVANDVVLQGEELLIQILTNNLVENALKYSAKDKPVTVSLSQDSGSIKLVVADEGVGINGEEKMRVFEKFYRVGNESTRTAKGTGLGLYLSKKIVSDHNGDIVIADNQPAGAVVKVVFKR